MPITPSPAPPILRRALDEVAPHRRAVAWASPVAALWAVWASGPGWATPAVVVAAVAGVALFAVDARSHRLPDAITVPTTVAVAALLLVAALAGGTWDAALRALLGALALAGGYLALHLINRAGLGLGDVKLAVLLGLVSAWFGWPALGATAFLPFLVGGVVAIVLLATRRATRTTAIAFGPYMLVGAALALTGARLVA
ncbi:A24 family peptidase [Isoptericola sp. 4D.3]|uniref:A24 family peptidase n=1 Tax=Isoptericola peretonis TaxID=2918523 RepID=A0ABT0J123_9MICO|nr:A24 family peptidase [Isoptericola sp. 4D.3]